MKCANADTTAVVKDGSLLRNFNWPTLAVNDLDRTIDHWPKNTCKAFRGEVYGGEMNIIWSSFPDQRNGGIPFVTVHTALHFSNFSSVMGF